MITLQNLFLAYDQALSSKSLHVTCSHTNCMANHHAFLWGLPQHFPKNLVTLQHECTQTFSIFSQGKPIPQVPLGLIYIYIYIYAGILKRKWEWETNLILFPIEILFYLKSIFTLVRILLFWPSTCRACLTLQKLGWIVAY